MAGEVTIPIAYVSGTSWFHKLHPIPKLIWAIGALVLAFSTRNPLFLSCFFLFGFLLIILAGILNNYLKVLLILLPISLSFIVLQSLAPAFPRPWVTISELGPFTIYQEGIYSGISLFLRCLAAVNFASLMILTTHPSDLFTALHKIGMPHQANFMVSTSLQLIPIVQREFIIILSAQRSRGMKSTGFSAVIPSIVPVFAGTIERIQQLSLSLASRAFGSKGLKTNIREIQATFKDYASGVIGLGCTFVGAWYLIYYSDQLDWSEDALLPVWFSEVLVVGSAMIFIGTILYFWRKAKG
jgi:energy-coupling factor transport system permease protein